MKKIISVFLILVMTIMMGTTSIKAEINEEKLESEFFSFCDNIRKAGEGDTVSIYDSLEADSVIFFHGGCNWIFEHQSVAQIGNLGDWYFITGLRQNGMSGLDVYVKTADKIYPLEDAYENNVITDLTPVAMLKGPMFYHLGDINGDIILNIKDATALQKYLANIETEIIINGLLQREIFDMNKDEKINIRDVTAIQKYLVGIEI